jgi:hypothetical protein
MVSMEVLDAVNFATAAASAARPRSARGTAAVAAVTAPARVTRRAAAAVAPVAPALTAGTRRRSRSAEHADEQPTLDAEVDTAAAAEPGALRPPRSRSAQREQPLPPPVAVAEAPGVQAAVSDVLLRDSPSSETAAEMRVNPLAEQTHTAAVSAEPVATPETLAQILRRLKEMEDCNRVLTLKVKSLEKANEVLTQSVELQKTFLTGYVKAAECAVERASKKTCVEEITKGMARIDAVAESTKAMQKLVKDRLGSADCEAAAVELLTQQGKEADAKLTDAQKSVTKLSKQLALQLSRIQKLESATTSSKPVATTAATAAVSPRETRAPTTAPAVSAPGRGRSVSRDPGREGRLSPPAVEVPELPPAAWRVPMAPPLAPAQQPLRPPAPVSYVAAAAAGVRPPPPSVAQQVVTPPPVTDAGALALQRWRDSCDEADEACAAIGVAQKLRDDDVAAFGSDGLKVKAARARVDWAKSTAQRARVARSAAYDALKPFYNRADLEALRRRRERVSRGLAPPDAAPPCTPSPPLQNLRVLQRHPAASSAATAAHEVLPVAAPAVAAPVPGPAATTGGTAAAAAAADPYAVSLLQALMDHMASLRAGSPPEAGGIRRA